MSGLIKFLFVLPPVEKRRDISRSWINPVFNGRMAKDHNDLYVYWRCYVISALVFFSYVAAYQVNYFFGLGLPVQFVHGYDPVRNFSYSYSLISIPLALFIMGYGLISLMANLDLRTFDLTWWQLKNLPQKQVERIRKFYGVSNINHPKLIRLRFWIVLVGSFMGGVGSTIVLSYYDDLAYSSVYQILIGFVLCSLSVIIFPALPLWAAHYYQLHKGWLPPVVDNP